MTTLFRRIAHYAAYLLAALVILVSVVALLLRFAVMPDIDRYKSFIESSASRAVGVPVRIDAIEADWWWLSPRFSLRGVALIPPGRHEALRLGQVDATLSWFSLAMLEPHLARLDIVQPSLEIRRDGKGIIHVAGIPVNVPGAPNPFPDWLLRQRTVTVTGGKVTWLDETLSAPPLILDQVNLRLESRFRRHRFGLTALPPANAARLIDLRGDLRGESVHRLPDWSGQLYARVDQASASALHAWAPWAQESVKRSVGDLRFWLTVAEGKATALTGDVDLSDVAVSLGGDLQDMTFRQVAGRLGWQRGKLDHAFYVDHLRFVTTAGHSAAPANVRVVVRPDEAGRPKEATVAADHLRLETLTALSGALPIPRQGHDWVAAFNPRGDVEHAEVAWLGKSSYRLKARFRDVGINATADVPGIAGLTGEMEMDEKEGRVSLATGRLVFDYDKVFRQPLEFDRLKAELVWHADARGGYRFELGETEISNADLDGHARGNMNWRPGTSPVIDLQAALTRGKGNAVWRYLPRQAGDAAHDWVKRSVIEGASPDTRLILRGPMDRFPFDKGGGEFRVDVQLRDAVLDYVPGWPRITAINGLLTFKDKSMFLSADGGDILGARLSQVQVVIPDLLHSPGQELLQVDGQARGQTATFLDFIRQSPVNDHTARFTEGMRASGEGALRLKLTLPLHHLENSSVAGRFSLADNRIVLGDELPDLEGVTGDLEFTEAALKGSDIAARLHGQPVRIDLMNEVGGRLRANLRGTVAAASLGEWLPAGLVRRLSGSAPFQAEVVLRQRKASLTVGSSLAGLAVDLPPPFGKPAETPLPVSLSLKEGPGGSGHQVAARIGEILSATLARDATGWHRAAIQLGGPPPALPRNKGLWVRGNLRGIDLDAWRRVRPATWGAGNGMGELTLRDLNLTFNELIVLNRRFHDINVQATPLNPGWRLKLAGQEVEGEVEYTRLTRLPGYRLNGNFNRLIIPRDFRPNSRLDIAEPSELPGEIDISARSLVAMERDLGDLDMKLVLERQGLRIDRLVLRNPEARLDGGGWLSISPLRASEVSLRLQSANLGKLLHRIKYPEDIRGGELTVHGTLNWLGGPADFSLDRINGKLKTQLRNGRFTQIDPGAGRLITILSLQALPRRVVLDFRDVFSEGFVFDEIQGDIHFERGIGYLPDLRLSGPSARVRMNGQIDLLKESQVLRLAIQPRLDESVAMAGAILGGPVVGFGALVASKLLRDPIAKAASFEYLVTGGWSDPVVTKLARPPSPPSGDGP